MTSSGAAGAVDEVGDVERGGALVRAQPTR
jgi:hypothetical protein